MIFKRGSKLPAAAISTAPQLHTGVSYSKKRLYIDDKVYKAPIYKFIEIRTKVVVRECQETKKQSHKIEATTTSDYAGHYKRLQDIP